MPSPAADTHGKESFRCRCYGCLRRITGLSSLTRHLTHAPAVLRRLPSRRLALTGVAVIAVLALAIVGLRSIDRGAVADALAGADPRYLAVGILAYAVGQTISGLDVGPLPERRRGRRHRHGVGDGAALDRARRLRAAAGQPRRGRARGPGAPSPRRAAAPGCAGSRAAWRLQGHRRGRDGASSSSPSPSRRRCPAPPEACAGRPWASWACCSRSPSRGGCWGSGGWAVTFPAASAAPRARSRTGPARSATPGPPAAPRCSDCSPRWPAS